MLVFINWSFDRSESEVQIRLIIVTLIKVIVLIKVIKYLIKIIRILIDMIYDQNLFCMYFLLAQSKHFSQCIILHFIRIFFQERIDVC